MEKAVLIASFFRRRWPNGFECPSCGHDSYYTIRTRRLPLYQCRLCNHQTSVTAGTVMHRSRASLDKWAAAIDLLSSASGVNAVQLASCIGVTHKTAWLMLRKFRSAITESEAATMLRGPVQAAVRWLAPGYLFLSTSHKRYRKERIVLIGAAVDGGSPKALKFTVADDRLLDPGTKELTREGEATALRKLARSPDAATLLTGKRLVQSLLPSEFKEAERWLTCLFNGIGTKYLQNYLDEYGFRWNVAAAGLSPREQWERLCFRRPTAG